MTRCKICRRRPGHRRRIWWDDAAWRDMVRGVKYHYLVVCESCYRKIPEVT